MFSLEPAVAKKKRKCKCKKCEYQIYDLFIKNVKCKFKNCKRCFLWNLMYDQLYYNVDTYDSIL